jgi:hypothetical protein
MAKAFEKSRVCALLRAPARKALERAEIDVRFWG